MKKILAGAAALLGTAVSAQAADMAVKAPYLKAPVAMVYDWTGFYIGVNAGVGIGRDYTRVAIPAGLSFEASYLNPQGGLGGGQIGYNWQVQNSFFGALVFGAEADFQGTGMRDNFNCLIGCLPAQNNNISQKLDWFGTVRGRVGIATGPVLSYVTGGWAYGSVKTTYTETLPPGGAANTGAFASNQNRGGWVIGSGLEASLGGNWTGKIEYLYMNLGDRLDLFTLNGFAHAMSTDIREQIFRVGLNYRIGGNGAAYVPPPPSNWAGFYLGGNFGGGIGRDHTAFTFTAVGTSTQLFNLSQDGFNGGAQAGYNWQSGAFVYGVEADINYTDAKSSGSITRATIPGLGLGSTILESSRSEWLMTFRPRVGVTSGNALFYVTGGLAVADYSFTQGAVIPNCACGVTGTVSKTKAGWTVGAGIEYAVTPAWSVKGEYLYVDLGSESFNTNLAAGGFPLATFSHDVKLTESIGRFGLNYKWGSPVVARY